MSQCTTTVVLSCHITELVTVLIEVDILLTDCILHCCKCNIIGLTKSRFENVSVCNNLCLDNRVNNHIIQVSEDTVRCELNDSIFMEDHSLLIISRTNGECTTLDEINSYLDSFIQAIYLSTIGIDIVIILTKEVGITLFQLVLIKLLLDYSVGFVPKFEYHRRSHQCFSLPFRFIILIIDLDNLGRVFYID